MACGLPRSVLLAVDFRRAAPSQPLRNLQRRSLHAATDLRAARGTGKIRGMAADVERRDRSVGGVKHRCGDRADAGFVVAVAPGETKRAVVVELRMKLQWRDGGVRGHRPQIDAGIQSLDPFSRQIGQNDPAHIGRVRGKPAADADVAGERVVRNPAHQIDDLAAVEHAEMRRQA